MLMDDTNKKKKKTILLVIAAILLLLGGVAFGMNMNRWFPNSDAAKPVETTAAGTDKPKLEVDPNAGKYVAPETTESDEEAGIAIPGWGTIEIPAGKKDVQVDFPNPDANADKYYLSFELRLKDTDEVLYTSGLVPPGETIQHITLSRALKKGNYQAIIRVQPYTMDDKQTATNNADMETQLIVK